jgi:hypothetical protein
LAEVHRGDPDGLAQALRGNIFRTNIDDSVTVPNPAPITTTYDDAINSANEHFREQNIPVTIPAVGTIKNGVKEVWDNIRRP